MILGQPPTLIFVCVGGKGAESSFIFIVLASLEHLGFSKEIATLFILKRDMAKDSRSWSESLKLICT